MLGPWELSYGNTKYQFGSREFDVQLVQWGQGADNYDVDDVASPDGDGTWFGVDRIEAGEILIEVIIDFTDHPAPASVCAELALRARAALENAWRADWVRQGRGRLAELNLGGSCIVEGRPRRARFNDDRQNVGYITAVLPFLPSYPVSYLVSAESPDGWFEAQASIAPAQASGGWVFPLVFPLMNLEPSTESRSFEVTGDTPSPCIVYIHGPIEAGAAVEINGWTLRTNRRLNSDQIAVADARPGRVSLTVNGEPENFLAPNSARLSEMILQPGTRQITLRGVSPQGTAIARVRWRNTRSGISNGN